MTIQDATKKEVVIGQLSFKRWLVLLVICLLMFGAGYFAAKEKATREAYADATAELNKVMAASYPTYHFLNINNTIVLENNTVANEK